MTARKACAWWCRWRGRRACGGHGVRAMLSVERSARVVSMDVVCLRPVGVVRAASVGRHTRAASVDVEVLSTASTPHGTVARSGTLRCLCFLSPRGPHRCWRGGEEPATIAAAAAASPVPCRLAVLGLDGPISYRTGPNTARTGLSCRVVRLTRLVIPARPRFPCRPDLSFVPCFALVLVGQESLGQYPGLFKTNPSMLLHYLLTHLNLH